MKKTRILFVCLGNICRSPLAHAVFEDMVEKAGLSDEIEIESCGTGAWHVGNLPDKRMRAEAKKHGINMTHPARTLHADDFEDFDMIFPMDLSNRKYLLSQCPDEYKHKIKLFRTFDPDAESAEAEVPDPYFGGAEGFAHVYDIVDRTAKVLLEEVKEVKNKE